MIRWTEKEYALLGGKPLPKTTYASSKQVISGYKSNVSGWRTIGEHEHYFRSLWEINYAITLQWYKKTGQIGDWEFEPCLFKFPKDAYQASPFQYLPDFKVTENNGSHAWHEVKGYMDAASKKKIKRFNKHYPKEKLIIIDSKWFADARKKQINVLLDWEKLPK